MIRSVRSVRIHEFGGPEVLRIEEIEVEEPGEGEVHMRIRGVGINRTEITLRSGRSPANPPLPAKIGFEAAGDRSRRRWRQGLRNRGSCGFGTCVRGQPVW